MRRIRLGISLLIIMSANSFAGAVSTLQGYHNIAMIGVGHVGLSSAIGLAELGNTVICTDIDIKKVELLQAGIVPFNEPGFKELVDRHVGAGSLSFVVDAIRALESAEVIYVATDFSTAGSGGADVSCLKMIVDMIVQTLKNYKVIVIKSSVPVGTGASIKSLLLNKGIDLDLFDIVSNPGLLQEGASIADLLQPGCVVIGTDSRRAYTIMSEYYASLIMKQGVCFVTDVVTAEIINKYSCDTSLFRPVPNFDVVDEMVKDCELYGGNIKIIAKFMGLDERICPYFLPAKDSGDGQYRKNCSNILDLF